MNIISHIFVRNITYSPRRILNSNNDNNQIDKLNKRTIFRIDKTNNVSRKRKASSRKNLMKPTPIIYM